MIRSFRDKNTEKLFRDERVVRWVNIEAIARRKLLMVDSAISLESLKIPPGNRLEPLKGNRKGLHSIRINDQWRVCFEWEDGHAYKVEIVDYH